MNGMVAYKVTIVVNMMSTIVAIDSAISLFPIFMMVEADG